jgi:hypothetical protein
VVLECKFDRVLQIRNKKIEPSIVQERRKPKELRVRCSEQVVSAGDFEQLDRCRYEVCNSLERMEWDDDLSTWVGFDDGDELCLPACLLASSSSSNS